MDTVLFSKRRLAGLDNGQIRLIYISTDTVVELDA